MLDLLTAGLDAGAGVPDASAVSPGIVGFLVTFALAVVTVLLMRDMVTRLRRLRYSPDPALDLGSAGPDGAAGQGGAAGPDGAAGQGGAGCGG